MNEKSKLIEQEIKKLNRDKFFLKISKYTTGNFDKTKYKSLQKEIRIKKLIMPS